MDFPKELGERAAKMLAAILAAGEEGKLGVSLAKDADGELVPYLCIVEREDDEKSVLTPLAPLLGTFSHGFQHAVPETEKSEIIQATIMRDDTAKSSKMDLTVNGKAELGDKMFSPMAKFIFNTVCQAALDGKLACVNARDKDGNLHPHLAVISEWQGLDATFMPVGPITGDYGDWDGPKVSQLDAALIGPADNVPSDIRHLAERMLKAVSKKLDPKDVN